MNLWFVIIVDELHDELVLSQLCRRCLAIREIFKQFSL